MADTAIEWASKVWNPVVGCSLQSPGCTNCYAMRMAWRLQNMASKADGTGNFHLDHYLGTVQQSKGGPVWTGQVNVAPDDVLLAPLRRKKPTDYFVNSMSDLFHPAVPFEVVDRVFAVMALSPQHTFKVLTKRSDRMRAYMTDFAAGRRSVIEAGRGLARPGLLAARMSSFSRLNPACSLTGAPPNIWLGVSVEDQRRADERREDFRATPAAVKFVSYEPALGPVDWAGWDFVHQIIGGGESGPKARPSHPQWHRETRDFCASHGVAYFHKQNGEYASVSEVEGPGEHYHFPDGATVRKVGKKRAGRLLDGVEHNGMPEVRHG